MDRTPLTPRKPGDPQADPGLLDDALLQFHCINTVIRSAQAMVQTELGHTERVQQMLDLGNLLELAEGAHLDGCEAVEKALISAAKKGGANHG